MVTLHIASGNITITKSELLLISYTSFTMVSNVTTFIHILPWYSKLLHLYIFYHGVQSYIVYIFYHGIQSYYIYTYFTMVFKVTTFNLYIFYHGIQSYYIYTYFTMVFKVTTFVNILP